MRTVVEIELGSPILNKQALTLALALKDKDIEPRLQDSRGVDGHRWAGSRKVLTKHAHVEKVIPAFDDWRRNACQETQFRYRN